MSPPFTLSLVAQSIRISSTSFRYISRPFTLLVVPSIIIYYSKHINYCCPVFAEKETRGKHLRIRKQYGRQKHNNLFPPMNDRGRGMTWPRR
ncbi:hypothetical protein SODALDRAFT_105837 [Sodiomyces alkalinus F11]|uniref:Uncharacterized protein n=1 Tax=Sodiomyces alkalinus (strain CBS 110278 / VKM F-3762 / F11) TaxID=1314773 RepID=A0A3N2Q257_SODAK|nr:hypothetical protein SODALDRAFT_105837 [Sodiomyces alkalinus F11]ROT40839.1 hypothetical protein SODALDRAFT_105837 [Sodiomyces alkalinus F11]